MLQNRERRNVVTETDTTGFCFHFRNLMYGSPEAAWTGRTAVSRAR